MLLSSIISELGKKKLVSVLILPLIRLKFRDVILAPFNWA